MCTVVSLKASSRFLGRLVVHCRTGLYIPLFKPVSFRLEIPLTSPKWLLRSDYVADVLALM